MKISTKGRRKTKESTPAHSVLIAHLVGLFGLRGELKCDPTAAGTSVLAAGLTVQATIGGQSRAIVVATLRAHGRRYLASFEGYGDANAAQALVGAQLFADAGAIVLAEDEYLDADLIGCGLFDPAGLALGSVVDIAHYPAQDVLIVGEQRAIVPLVKAFVRSIDIAAKRITIDLPSGLLDEREAEEG